MNFKKIKILIKYYFERKNLLDLKKIFFFAGLFYFLYFFFDNLNNLSFRIDINKYGIQIFLSFFFSLLSIFFNAIAWQEIIHWFNKSSKVNKGAKFFILTNSLKYIPGGVWHFIERFNFLRKDHSKLISLYVVIIEPFFMLSAALFIAAIGIIHSPFYIIFLLPLIFLNKKLIYMVLRKLEKLKKESRKFFKELGEKDITYKEIEFKTFFPFKPFLYEVAFVLSKFVGFIICFNFININNEINLIKLLIVFCLSWSIGLIVPAAPGGAAVFESSFLLLIGKNMNQELIIVALIYFRLITTLSDLFLSLPLLLKKYIPRN